MLRNNFLYVYYKHEIYNKFIYSFQSSHYFIKVCKNSNDYPINKIIQLKRHFSVVACQRYVCPNVISMTMNVIIQECIIENCFIEPYV